MLKCAPYIKNLCSSLQSGLWKEASASSNGPSSLPGSPIRRPRHETKVQLPSPTRSEGMGVASEDPGKGLEAMSMPTLLATASDLNGGSEVITTVVKSDMTHVLRKVRPESPDVTRAAKRLEMSKSNHLGAISKLRSRGGGAGVILVGGAESPTPSTSSSVTSSASSSQT